MNNNVQVGAFTGSNNNFNQKNIYNNNGGGKKTEDDPASTGLAAMLGLFGLAVVGAVSLLNNYEAAFFWLKLLAIAGGGLHLLTLLSQVYDASYRPRDSVAPSVGVVLTASTAWLLAMTFNALPQEVLAIASQPTVAHGFVQQKFEVWARFSHEGQRLILDNLMSALFLAISALFNVGVGLQCLLCSLGQAQQSSACTRAGHWLRFFKTAGVFIAVIAALASFLAISGFFSGHLA